MGVRAHRNPFYSNVLGAVKYTIATEGSNAIAVAVQFQDNKRADVGERVACRMWLSSDANGDTPLTDPPSGGVAAGTDGTVAQVPVPTGLHDIGTLAISATAERFKTTTTALYRVNGVQRTKAATDNLTFSAAHVITASKFGVVLVQINGAGTVSTKVPASPQAYNTDALALAALPAPDAGNVPLGYIAIENNAGDWTGNTDDLTAASDVTTAAFVDWPTNGGYGTHFDVTSEADGDLDLVVTETRIRTMYLNARLPDGSVWSSGALAFT
jgi:hypothetical protein